MGIEYFRKYWFSISHSRNIYENMYKSPKMRERVKKTLSVNIFQAPTSTWRYAFQWGGGMLLKNLREGHLYGDTFHRQEPPFNCQNRSNEIEREYI